MTGEPVSTVTLFPGTTPGQPRLLDRVRTAIRTRHYSLRTEEAYVGWIKRLVFFHFGPISPCPVPCSRRGASSLPK